MGYIAVEANTSKIAREIATKFDLIYTQDSGEFTAMIPNAEKEGVLHAINFNGGLGLFYLDCFIRDELTINFLSDEYHPLQFFFCLKGNMLHNLQAFEQDFELRTMKGSISCSSETFQETIQIPPDQHLNLCYLVIDRSAFFEHVDCETEGLPTNLKNILENPELDRPLMHMFDLNLEITKEINEIKSKSLDGLLRRSFLESKAFELFYMMVSQYKFELEAGKRKVKLSEYDLQQIQTAKSILENNLKDSPSITDLAKEIGLNVTKLKTGFRKVYGITIKHFVINSRMEMAKELIIEGKMSIGQVAEEIGYQNRSHFSRMFKQKYGVLPSAFSDSIKRIAI